MAKKKTFRPTAKWAAAQLAAALDPADPVPLAAAVLRVYAENEAQAAVNGCPANDPSWAAHSDMRADLFRRTRTRWCEATGCGFHRFPFSEDGVAWLYARCGRASAETRALWAAQVTPKED